MAADYGQGDSSWFVKDRFGMFIHWGLYALAARHEWVKNRERISTEAYQKYFDRFDPDLYDPTRRIVRLHAAGNETVSFQIVIDAGDQAVAGLVLWASWPANDLSAEALEVTSIYGSQDGLAEPAQVLAGAADLPTPTTFVEVAGAVHAYFGDYGEQPGDGEPTTSRAEAQAEIVAATVALLDRLAEDAATDGER